MSPRVAVALILIALALGLGGVKPPAPRYIDLPGFNVLVLTETSAGQAVNDNVTRSPLVRSWLEQNADEFFVWDDSTTDFEFVAPQWREAFDLAVTESEGVRPWLLVSGQRGSSGPLPSDPQELLELLEGCR